MKRQLILSIAFSVLAANAFAASHSHDALAADGSDRTPGVQVAADGSDRTPGVQVAADGSDRLKGNQVAADGSDRLKGNQVAEGGSDRLQQNRVALNPANAVISGVLVADNRAEFGSKYQRY